MSLAGTTPLYSIGVLHFTGQRAESNLSATTPQAVLDELASVLLREIRRLKGQAAERRLRAQLARAADAKGFTVGRTFWFTAACSKIGDVIAYAVPAGEPVKFVLPKPPRGQRAA